MGAIIVAGLKTSGCGRLNKAEHQHLDFHGCFADVKM